MALNEQEKSKKIFSKTKEEVIFIFYYIEKTLIKYVFTCGEYVFTSGVTNHFLIKPAGKHLALHTSYTTSPS